MKKRISSTLLPERKKLPLKPYKTLWTKKMIISEWSEQPCMPLWQLTYQIKSIWKKTTQNPFYILSVISVWDSYLGDIKPIKKDLKEWCITKTKLKVQSFSHPMFFLPNLLTFLNILGTFLMIKKWILILYSRSFLPLQDLWMLMLTIWFSLIGSNSNLLRLILIIYNVLVEFIPLRLQMLPTL